MLSSAARKMDPISVGFIVGICIVIFVAILVIVCRKIYEFLVDKERFYFPHKFDDGQCAICLNPHENKSHPHCGHVYCYQCLVDWCRIKLECPTCKEPFKVFRHSIRSSLNFRIYVPYPLTVKTEEELFFPDYFIPAGYARPFEDNAQQTTTTPYTEDELFQHYFQSTADQILPPL